MDCNAILLLLISFFLFLSWGRLLILVPLSDKPTVVNPKKTRTMLTKDECLCCVSIFTSGFYFFKPV